METSLTPTTLQHYYEQLYVSIKTGQLEKCLECHLSIASILRSTGALLLAGRHSLMAHRIGQVIQLLNERNHIGTMPGPSLREANNKTSEKVSYILRNDWLDSLELKLIALLREGELSQSEILHSLFGGYSADLTGEKVLSKLVDNINRHLARIIDVSPVGYRLKLA